MSVLQISSIIDYLDGQPELALGRCMRTKEGRSQSKRLWQECASILNNVMADCVQKTPDQWRAFYNEYKHKMLKKIKYEKNERTATGGGPSKAIMLSPLQERLYNILGRDVGEPLPGVRHNPFSYIQNEGGTSSNSVNVAIPDDDNKIQADFGFNHMEFVLKEYQPEPSSSQAQPSAFQLQQEPEGQGQQPDLSSTQVAEQSQHLRQPAPRRRRRRYQQISEPDDTISKATATLEAMDNLRAQATREHAQATNRLAAALEAISDRLKEPIKIILEDPSHTAPRKRYRENIRL